VQRVNSHNLAIAIYHGKGPGSDQEHFWMPDGIFAAIRSADRKRLKSASQQALANSRQIHAATLSPRLPAVKKNCATLCVYG